MNWLSSRFELARGGSTQNMRPMEGLRGLAVFLVFLVHYVTLVQPWVANSPELLGLGGRLHAVGNTGVDLFFVLSGYLIYGSLIARPQAFGRFIWRRFVRIYPAFLVVFAVYLGLSFAFPAESKIPGSALGATAYLLQNLLLLPGLFPIEPMITVAWSLSYEMFYYLVVPLIIWALGLRERSPAWRAAFFLGLSLLTIAYCASYGGHVRLIMFVAGILVYEALPFLRAGSPGGTAGLLALLLGLAATWLPWGGPAAFALKISILYVTFFVLCLACFRDPAMWLSRRFSWTPLRWLGNMSYSYYLLHGLALKASFLLLGKLLPPGGHEAWYFWTLLPLMFGLSLLPTAALFLLVERPLSLVSGSGRDGRPAPSLSAKGLV